MIQLFGIVFLLGLGVLLSENRKEIHIRTVVGGLLLQFVLAVLVLGIPKLGVAAPLKFFFVAFTQAVDGFMAFSLEGAAFVFGSLVDINQTWGFIFAAQVGPTIIFFSAVTAVAYHLGFLQIVVKGFAYIMKKSLHVGGAESLAASAEIFLGQTESPLLIKPYLPKLTRSELFAVMVGGMATVAGGVMAAYIGLLRDRIPDIAGHLLTASILSAPSALVVSKILIPENKKLVNKKSDDIELAGSLDANVIDSAARGATEGLTLALNVIAMLIAFIALIATVNSLLHFAFGLFGVQDFGLQNILGILFFPFAYAIGIPFEECTQVAALLGEKVALNEFVAYVNLSKIGTELSDRSVMIASYALCGFANFSSIGIQIGGTGAMAPGRRAEIAKLGLKAVIGGNLAGFITAWMAGVLN